MNKQRSYCSCIAKVLQCVEGAVVGAAAAVMVMLLLLVLSRKGGGVGGAVYRCRWRPGAAVVMMLLFAARGCIVPCPGQGRRPGAVVPCRRVIVGTLGAGSAVGGRPRPLGMTSVVAGSCS